MTTQEAIDELSDNIYSFPEIRSIEVHADATITLHFHPRQSKLGRLLLGNRSPKEFFTGDQVVIWMEENLRHTEILTDEDLKKKSTELLY